MGRRLLFGIEVGGLLALLAIPCLLGMLYLLKSLSFTSMLVATTPASVSAFIVAVAMLLFKDLAGELRVEFPMNLAFPLIFGIVNLTVARAIWFSPSVVRAPHEILNPIQLWFDPRMIVLTFAVQVVALTVASRPWDRADSNEPTQAG
jgi:hypothetical protein